MKVIDRLKIGDFNELNLEQYADLSVLITLTKRGEHKVYKLHVKDPYKDTEEVLEEQEIEA